MSNWGAGCLSGRFGETDGCTGSMGWLLLLREVWLR